jgi:hypothetical protein
MHKRWMLVGIAAVTLLGACGGDDSSSSTKDTSGGTSSSSDFCAKAQKVEDANQQLDPSTSDSFKKGLDNLIAAMSDAIKSAPSDLKPVMQVQLDATKKARDLAKKFDYDITKLNADAEFNALSSSLGDAAAVTAYLGAQCGIEANLTN